jgi:hypothetical protein
MARGHVPERSCVACRQARPKEELLRVVRTPDGQIKADPVGKTPGRGAYVCPAEQCIQAAVKHRKLERALGKQVDEGTLAEIVAFAARAER